MRLQRISALTLFVLLLAAATAWAAIPDRPAQDIYVQDYAGLLSQETKDRILAIGHELDEKTTDQIAVVTVRTLDDRPIADYANELFRSWGIGDKTLNNGVLLLISQDPRKMRIEVGYGLEGALPDGLTGQIRDEQIVPALHKNDYDEGVLKGYDALVEAVQKEYNVSLDTAMGEEFRQARIDAGNAAFWAEWNGFWDDYGIYFKVGFGIFIALIVILFVWIMIKPQTLGNESPGSSSSGGHRHHHRHDNDSWFGGGGSGGGFGGGSSGGGGSEGDY